MARDACPAKRKMYVPRASSVDPENTPTRKTAALECRPVSLSTLRGPTRRERDHPNVSHIGKATIQQRHRGGRTGSLVPRGPGGRAAPTAAPWAATSAASRGRRPCATECGWPQSSGRPCGPEPVSPPSTCTVAQRTVSARTFRPPPRYAAAYLVMVDGADQTLHGVAEHRGQPAEVALLGRLKGRRRGARSIDITFPAGSVPGHPPTVPRQEGHPTAGVQRTEFCRPTVRPQAARLSVPAKDSTAAGSARAGRCGYLTYTCSNAWNLASCSPARPAPRRTMPSAPRPATQGIGMGHPEPLRRPRAAAYPAGRAGCCPRSCRGCTTRA